MNSKIGLKYKFIYLSTLSVVVTVLLGGTAQYFLSMIYPGYSHLFIVAFSLFYILIGLAAVFIFTRIMIRPVVSLTAKVRKIRDGDLSVRFSEKPPHKRIDEMDLLFDGFKHMITTLRESIDQLTQARDRAEKSSIEAQKNHNRLEAIFNSISDGIMIVDEDYNILASNKNMRRIFGHEEESIIGEHCYQLCNGSQTVCSFCNAEKVLQTGTPRYTFCTKEKNATYAEKIYEVHNFPLYDAPTNKSYIIEYVKDVTEAIQMRTDVEHAQRLADIGTMAGKVAHEVRNPLNAIKGAAHFLRSEIENEEAGRYLLLIEEQVERVNGVTTQLLSLTKPLAPALQPATIENSLDRALQVTRPQMMAKAIRVNIVRDDILPQIYINEGQMEQALINIIINAIDAMHREGKLDIQLHTLPMQNKSRFVVNIHDNGCGLPDAEADELFKPFFTTKTKGTGLGLAIIKRIIENHNAEFILRNSENSGTEALLVFPLGENQ